MDDIQLLKDPLINPTTKIIAAGLGKANNIYLKFLDNLKKYDISLMDWRYYNDGKAWLSKGEYKWTTERGTKKIKPIFWLSIWNGFFKVSFFFSEKIRNELLALPISSVTKELITSADSMGKTMKFLPIIFDISEEKQLADIYILVQFRKEKI